jgi:hypothetical protein
MNSDGVPIRKTSGPHRVRRRAQPGAGLGVCAVKSEEIELDKAILRQRSWRKGPSTAGLHPSRTRGRRDYNKASVPVCGRRHALPGPTPHHRARAVARLTEGLQTGNLPMERAVD